jgi:hypothetical protein
MANLWIPSYGSKNKRSFPFIISVNYGINIAWEDRQVELRGKVGRNSGAMGSVALSHRALAISNKEGS